MKLFVLAALLAVTAAACSGDSDTPTVPALQRQRALYDRRPAGRHGRRSSDGTLVAVDYTGWLYSASAADNKGTRFDSSLDAGKQPFVLVAGGTGAIAGFSQAVVGMRVGGQRRVTIPPSLGYGSQANGPIPGNSTLIFEIELLAIQP